MPELPEVERAARRIRKAVVGQTIVRVTLLHPSLRRRVTPRSLASLRGHRVTSVDQRAKQRGPSVDANISRVTASEACTDLTNFVMEYAPDCLTDGEAGKFVNGGSVQEILSNPTGFYVNIHNSIYPSGAIRGQLGYSTSE